MHYEKSSIVLMPQSTHVVFCYYNISSMTIKDFEDIYGEDSWKNSKPVLKVYEVDDGIAKEIETIYLDVFADNWYINLDKTNIHVFVKLGRILADDKFVSIAISNTVITPRESQSDNTDICYIDISKDYREDTGKVLPIYDDECDFQKRRNEPKPYPFISPKKNTRIIH
ncbi:DUF4912 domain-containing protein [Clostridium botulinum D/C]|uniref:DUF4912 domain-containing protein n=1 Tax=Clostridium botulinum TaxID=1491 RepID=UPI001E312E49|nr:DUF4912 domain-containing protein [Clostridium botulinum]MCD3351542.1 DUF4912 domain-containing protein [Clostridium botulinum D/C]MCD3360497.1 DUF4912 domain-containing protein [Clostridium botulinum D/C]MCD3363812.1 DUF4912 domain-containing protein [Clostridium botulinum D/C]MCD3366272.1 DUF4912 domain-containing protein [Clostridium botulinum D/C]